MTELFLLVISTVFVNNLLFELAVGADPIMQHSKRADMARGFSIALMLLLPLTTSIAYVLHCYLLQPYNLAHASLLLYVVLIICLASIIKFCLSKKPLFKHTLGYFPLVVLNTIALASILFSLEQVDSILAAFFYGLANAFAIALVMLIFSAMRERLELNDIPLAFKGMPIDLLSLGMLAMAFLGFTAMV